MAYKPRRKYVRKNKLKKIIKGKSTQIKTLATAVRSIQRKMKQKTVSLNYQQYFNTGLVGDCTYFKLSNYSNYTRIFGSAADDEQGNSMIHKSFGLDMYLSLENTVNEPDTTTFTIFLVSLKDGARGGMFNALNGDLTLSVGTDYCINGGLVLLNKKNFNIHSIKRKVLTNHGTALSAPSAQTQSGTDYRCYMKRRIGAKVHNVGGNWRDLQCSPDPSQNYYLLVFNDNSAVDLQNPVAKINLVHSIEQLA